MKLQCLLRIFVENSVNIMSVQQQDLTKIKPKNPRFLRREFVGTAIIHLFQLAVGCKLLNFLYSTTA